MGLCEQRLALFDAETVLFVHDDEAEIFELRLFLKQGVRPENDGNLSGRRLFQKSSFFIFPTTSFS